MEYFVLILLLIQEICARKYCMPTQACWPKASEIRTFKFRIAATGGQVIAPSDPNWPGRHMVYNPDVYKPPGLRVNVKRIENIKLSLAFAYRHNIRISIISTGHEFNGRSVAEGSLQISVHLMNNVTVDTACKEHSDGCMTAQSGALFGDLYKTANQHKRLVLGAPPPTVSVTGWTIGGGHSPLSRHFGLGIQNLLEVHLITAAGREVWASSSGVKVKQKNGSIQAFEDTSLFYALRGGGSSFGVIIDLKFKIHKEEPIFSYVCTYATFTDGTPRVYDVILKSIQELLKTAPRRFGSLHLARHACNYTTNVCAPSLIVSFHYYGELWNSSDVNWFYKLTNLTNSWAKQGINTGFCFNQTYPSYFAFLSVWPAWFKINTYVGGSLVQKHLLSNHTIDVIVHHLNKSFYESRDFNVVGIHLGGVLEDLPLQEFPISEGWKSAVLNIVTQAYWPDNSTVNTTALKSAIRDFHKDLNPFSRGKYFSELEVDLPSNQWKEEIWGMENYKKLLAVKRKWDPENRFTCHQCVGDDLS